eukprot:3050461-Prymnesium_polylepis.1
MVQEGAETVWVVAATAGRAVAKMATVGGLASHWGQGDWEVVAQGAAVMGQAVVGRAEVVRARAVVATVRAEAVRAKVEVATVRAEMAMAREVV